MDFRAAAVMTATGVVDSSPPRSYRQIIIRFVGSATALRVQQVSATCLGP
jgi:hypothetical protein